MPTATTSTSADFTAALALGRRLGSRYTLAPPRATFAGRQGDHLAQRVGSSIEFMDHRAYEIGDDLRHVDWSAYARTGRLIVKRFREEVSPCLDLLIDGSRSMDLPDTRKADAAIALAAALATAAGNAGFACRAALAGERIHPLDSANLSPTPTAPLRSRPIQTSNPSAPQSLGPSVPSPLGSFFTFPGTLEESLAKSPPVFRARSIRAIITDLLWPGDPLPLLRRLNENAASLIIIQMLAGRDVQPPDHGSLRLVDAETGLTHDLYLDATMQRRYRDRLAAHQRQWEDACRQTGAVLARFVDEDLWQDEDLRPMLSAGVLRIV